MTNITISAQVFEDMADRIEELEAKLAKAHLALNYFLLRDPDKPSSWEYTRNRAEQLARTTLAELTSSEAATKEGGKDEWKCPINYTGCTKNCGSYGCGN